MNSLTNATLGLKRPLVLIACLTLLALATIQPAGANQSGPPVDAANAQQALCRLALGEAEVTVHRTVEDGLKWISVKCKGGLLDGLTCDNYVYSNCYWESVRPDEPPAVRPTGGITVAAEDPAPAPQRANDIAVPPGLAEEPSQDVPESETSPTGVETESGSSAPVTDESNLGQAGHPLNDEAVTPTGGVAVADADSGAATGTILSAEPDEQSPANPGR